MSASPPRGLLRELRARAPAHALAAGVIEEGVARDREHPRQGRRAGREAAARAMDPHERLLRQIVGERGVARQANQEAAHPLGAAAVELVEGAVVARRAPLHDARRGRPRQASPSPARRSRPPQRRGPSCRGFRPSRVPPRMRNSHRCSPTWSTPESPPQNRARRAEPRRTGPAPRAQGPSCLRTASRAVTRQGAAGDPRGACRAPPRRPEAPSERANLERGLRGRGSYDRAMVANQEALGPSVGPIPARVFDAHPATLEKELDRIIGRLREHATEFARLHVATKIELLEDCLRGTRDVATDWVTAACRAKGISLTRRSRAKSGSPAPRSRSATSAFSRAPCARSTSTARPSCARSTSASSPHGAVGVRVTPYDAFDAALYGGITAETWLQPGIERARRRRSPGVVLQEERPRGPACRSSSARATSRPSRRWTSSTRCSSTGASCLLKMNPVNEYLGPAPRARAAAARSSAATSPSCTAAPRSARTFATTASIGDVHITGSDKTHDLIVWGPPGPGARGPKAPQRPAPQEAHHERAREREPGASSCPVRTPTRSSRAWPRTSAGMVTNNASFNCNAAKLLVAAQGLGAARHVHQEARPSVLATRAAAQGVLPGRCAALRGADHRPLRRAEDRERAAISTLPWTLVLGLDAANPSETIFSTEPFCSILSEVVDRQRPIPRSFSHGRRPVRQRHASGGR